MLNAMRLHRFDCCSLVSLVALVSAACGATDDGTHHSVPSFVGLTPDVPAPASTPTEPGPPNLPSNAATPADPAASGTEAPVDLPLAPNDAGAPQGSAQPETIPEPPGVPIPEPTETEAPPGRPSLGRPSRGTANLFTQLLGIAPEEVDAKVKTAVERVFGIGTGESATPNANSGYRLYYELPQDRTKAFIWCADQNDVRSEGQSYGMMIALQMNMQTEFDKLWKFAKEEMQITSDDGWNRYFRWQGRVALDGDSISVDFGANGPAPDGDEYFTAALYLADRRWGSAGGVNYEQEADAIASAMLHNTEGGGQTPLFDSQFDMVVFFPSGTAAGFSDPSYHLPAFYEIFARDADPADSSRWRQIAGVSRQFFVSSANPATGLHPDYANFDGTPNTGGNGQTHDQFRFDAWRVPMNMAIDSVWSGADPRLQTQVEKYHSFFADNGHLGDDNVVSSLFALDGQPAGDGGGSSTALTATLASGALISRNNRRADFVRALWEVGQQSGFYRYYQESVYLLGLLSTAGWYGYDWNSSE